MKVKKQIGEISRFAPADEDDETFVPNSSEIYLVDGIKRI